jgi:hypothetical protein
MLKTLPMIMICFLLGITGCNGSVALKPGQTDLDTSRKSIAIFTVRTENQLKPDFQTGRLAVFWKPASGNEQMLVLDSPENEGQHVSHVISLALEPGSYSITQIWGVHRGVLVFGTFQYKTNLKFDVPPNGVVYLGHVLLVNRQRKEGEERSGPIFPLIDQGASGFADGATDITISDASAEEVPFLIQRYPCLKNRAIPKSILTK